MAVGKYHWFGKGLLKVMRGEIDLLNDTLKAVLLDADYTPDQDVDDVLADIVADEIADGDYARVTLGGVAIALAGGVVGIDCNDIDFGDAVTIEGKYLVVFDDTHASDALLGFLDLNTATTAATLSSTASDFKVNTNAAGALSAEHEAYSAGN